MRNIDIIVNDENGGRARFVSRFTGTMRSMNQVQKFIFKELEQRVAFFGLQVGTTAQHFHTIAGHLRQDSLTQGIASFVDDGAKTIENIGHYLETATLESLATKAESLGRGRPLTFMTTAFALGIAGSRVMKASALSRYEFLGSDGGALEDGSKTQHTQELSRMSM